MPPKGPEQNKENPGLDAVEDAAKKNPEAGEIAEYRLTFNKLSKIIDGTNTTDKINDILTPEFQRTLLKAENKDGLAYFKSVLPNAIKNNPDNQELKDFADFLASTEVNNVQLSAENKDQELGLAQETPKWKINNIVNFVESNNAIVSEYNLI